MKVSDLVASGVIALSVAAAGCSSADSSASASSPATREPIATTTTQASPTNPAPEATTIAPPAPTTVGPAATTTEPPVATTTSPAPTTTSSTTSTTTTTTTTVVPSPLNGLPVSEAASLDRRVMAVKIDNHARARPQSGLQEAEAVFELLVEAGLTRFIALFHTVDSEYVGPIRSVRPTDPTLLLPLNAPMQISGGAGWILRSIARTGQQLLGDSRASGSTFRISTRPRPHNLFGNTIGMRLVADGRGITADPPPPMFIFGPPTEATGAATEIWLDWSRGNMVRWVYDRGLYLRYQGNAEHMWVDRDGNEDQVAFETIVVLKARRYTASPPAGDCCGSVPALDTVGSGAVFVFHRGRVTDGEWSRDSIREPFALTVDGDQALVLPSGRVWVTIFPSNRPLFWE